MEIKHLDKLNVMINGIYKITIEKFSEYKKAENAQEIMDMIDKFSAYKKEFISVKGIMNKSQTSVLSNLLEFEIKDKKDIVAHSFDEIVIILKDLSKRGVFTSKSVYNAHLNIIYHYTYWGYYSNLRSDIITIQDMTTAIPVVDAVDAKLLNSRILTPLEMDFYIKNCLQERVSVWLKAMTEGLKPNELVEIKKNQFEDETNHPLELTERTVSVSDELYLMMYTLARAFTGIKRIRNNNEKETNYMNTDYLFRVFESETSVNACIKTEAASSFVKQDLKNMDYDGAGIDFRSSAIMNDILDGMKVNEINEKYGLDYKFIESMGIKFKLEILKEKRRNEGI